MKQTIIKFNLLVIIIACSSMFTNAQQLNTSYFLEGATFRHELNPAYGAEHNYISIPILGNLNIDVNGNFGLEKFLYNYNDPTGEYNTTTFMSSTVNGDQFLNGLNDKTKLNFCVSMPIISFGYTAFGGFNTFGLNFRSFNNMNIPKDFFRFMKLGQQHAQGDKYHIEDLGMESLSYVELALGHSRRINNQWTVGAKVKLLFGGEAASLKINTMDVELSKDKWEIAMDGELNVAAGGEFEYKDDDNGMPTDKVSGLDVDSPGLNGLGIGIDLGTTFEYNENLTFSAAIIDLGFIKWSENLKAVNDPTKTFLFNGFSNFVLDEDNVKNGDQTLDDQVSDLQDDLEDLVSFRNKGEEARTTGLATTINLAGEYKMPFYDKLSAGLLWSSRIYGEYSSTELRLSANISPLKWFNASLSCGAGTYGTEIGWMLNFHPKGINFFIGGDSFLGQLNKQGVPLNNMNANLALGMNITF